jgi:NitT/TauT family transport system substrate-binding protein
MKLHSALLAAIVTLAGCGGTAAPAPSAPASSADATPAASAKPAASGGLIKINAALSSLSASNIPSWVGKEAAIFEKNGLDVDFKVIAGGSTTTSALLGGDVQMVMGGGSEALGAAAGGADLVIVGITVPTYPQIIYGPPSANSLADLKGKTFGVPANRGTVDVATRVALKSQGIDPDKDVKITALGSVQAVTAALLSGAIDAAAVNVPDNLAAEAKGLRPILNLATAKLPASSNSIYTQRSTITARRDMVQRYVDSIVQSIARVKADKPLAMAAIKKNLKLDDQRAVEATYEYYKAGVFPDYPYPRAELFKDARELVGEQNAKVLTFDVNTILDPSFIKSAEDRGLAR